MDANFAVDMAYRGLMIVLLVSLPAIVTAAVVGLAVAILQAATQIQDQSVGMALRMVALTAVLLLTARWAGSEIYQFADQLLSGVGMRGPGGRY